VDYALLRIDTLTGAGTFQAFIALEGVRSIAAGRLVTGVDPSGVSQLPLRFALEQNYPNPFNPTTLIRYELPRMSDVNLAVYDMLGREVALLVNERKGPGRYSVEFQASVSATGVYFCRLTAGAFTQTRKMLVVR
jgi:hypothetical protein